MVQLKHHSTNVFEFYYSNKKVSDLYKEENWNTQAGVVEKCEMEIKIWTVCFIACTT